MTQDAIFTEQEHERRVAEAAAGRYLPSYDDLLDGCPFFRSSLASDAAEFSRRLVDLHADRVSEELCAVLERLSIEENSPNPTYLQEADTLLDACSDPGRWDGSEPLQQIARRYGLYCAYAGVEAAGDRLVRVLGLHARSGISRDSAGDRFRAHLLGFSALRRRQMREGPDACVSYGMKFLVSETPEKKPDHASSQNDGTPPEDPDGVVVLRGVGGIDSDYRSAKAAEVFKSVIGRRIPSVKCPDIDAAHQTMAARFPHAVSVTDRIFGELRVHADRVALAPTVFVSAPGTGKTEYAISLLKMLEIPHAVYPCGGVRDDMISGTARGYGSAQPSLPADLIRRHVVANPGIVLDEIEKVSVRDNALLDSLLSMIEPASSRTYHDKFLVAPIDLGHVLWIGTANRADLLPAPLRDRFRVIDFPAPAIDHVASLAAGMARRIRIDRGETVDWLPDLDVVELRAVAEAWRGGSLRRLRRLVEGVIAAREAYARTNMH